MNQKAYYVLVSNGDNALFVLGAESVRLFYPYDIDGRNEVLKNDNLGAHWERCGEA